MIYNFFLSTSSCTWCVRVFKRHHHIRQHFYKYCHHYSLIIPQRIVDSANKAPVCRIKLSSIALRNIRKDNHALHSSPSKVLELDFLVSFCAVWSCYRFFNVSVYLWVLFSPFGFAWIMDPDIVCRDTSGLVSAVSSTLFLISLCPLSCSFQAASLFVLFTLSLSLSLSISTSFHLLPLYPIMNTSLSLYIFMVWLLFKTPLIALLWRCPCLFHCPYWYLLRTTTTTTNNTTNTSSTPPPTSPTSPVPLCPSASLVPELGPESATPWHWVKRQPARPPVSQQ